MKWADYEKGGGDNSMSILGWNSRSATSPTNEMAIRKYLSEYSPDVILLNENGPLEKKHLYGVAYKCITLSLKTAVIFNEKYSVHKTLPLWKNEFNTIVKLNSDKKSILLYSFYKSHQVEENDLIDQLLYRLGAIKDRYIDFSLILYGDFNMDRKKFKRMVEDRLPMGYVCHYSEDETDSTRAEMRMGVLIESYIDYMITYACVTGQLQVIDPIGHSDHKTLMLLIDKHKSLMVPYIRKFCTNIMTKIRNDGAKNHEGFVNAILSYDPLSGLLSHIR
jgi:hypothetical protein